MNHIVSRGHTRPVTEIQFTEDGPDRTLLASSAHDKTPQLRDGDSGDWLGTFHGHKGAVWSIKIDKFSRTLAVTASGDFTAKLWSVQNGKELYEFKHRHVVKSGDFRDDTLKIATGAQDGLVKIFDTCQPSSAAVDIKVSNSMTDGVMKINWVDDNKVLVAKRNASLELWDIRSSSIQPDMKVTLQGGCPVIDMELTKDRDIIMAASGNHVSTLKLTDLSIIKVYEMPEPLRFNEEGGVSLSPSGRTFLAGGSDLWLREFDFESGELLQTFKGHHGPIRCIRYHPSRNVGASGSEDGTIRIWELSNSEKIDS